jgi:putative tricarboxylic transport membrane protein
VFDVLLDYQVWLYLALGVSMGVLFGSLPGFTATMGIAILTPLTFWSTPEHGFAMLFGLLSSAVFSGGIPAILINTPGTPASIATSWDGYPLAQQGRAGVALGANALGAFSGQVFSILMLGLVAFPVARLALRFGPPEYFALAVFGISMMVSIASRDLVKGLLMGLLGLALSLVGLDPMTGFPRFTFGAPGLLEGISFIPAMVGLFGVAEVLLQMVSRVEHQVRGILHIDRILPPRSELGPLARHAAVGSSIGTVVGAIPGAGGDIGSIIAWEQSRRLSRRGAEFGKGSLRGLFASTSAANASIGGAMMTMLTLGIPGDSVSAVLIGALLIHGLQPGPLLFRDHPEVVTHIVTLLLMASSLTLVIGMLGARPLARVLQLKEQILWGLILVLCVLGSFALNRSLVDVWIMLAAGVIGFILRKADFPAGPLVLALILGPMAESNLRRALVISQGDASVFFTRPISLTFLVLTALSLLLPLWRRRLVRPKEPEPEDRPDQ